MQEAQEVRKEMFVRPSTMRMVNGFLIFRLARFSDQDAEVITEYDDFEDLNSSTFEAQAAEGTILVEVQHDDEQWSEEDAISLLLSECELPAKERV